MGQVRQPPERDPEPGGEDDAVEVLDPGSKTRRLTAASASGSGLHRFCQFDFSFLPGPADGRYLLRGGGATSDVIVVKTVGADPKRERGARFSLGRARAPRPAADEDPPEPVAITRVTVVRGSPFADEASAREWLAACCADPDSVDDEVAECLRLLNRAIQAHRVSASDPYSTDAARRRARRIRIGFGSGHELVEGRSRDVYEVPEDGGRRRRRRMLAPEEQVAQILGGRRPTWPSEELLLRARLDLDQGRTREAALQALAAHGPLAAELEADPSGDVARSAIDRHAPLLGRLGAAARERELDESEVESLGGALAEMERVMRRRRHALDAEASG